MTMQLERGEIYERPLVEIRRHTIERISERLGTISDKEIRNELAPAIAGIHLAKLLGRNGWVRTPNGIAPILFENCHYVMSTWINNELLTASQRKWEWEELGEARDQRGHITAEAPGSPLIYSILHDPSGQV